MVVTVRLDEKLESTLNRVAKTLHKKKSRIQKAIEKTKDIDKKEFKDFRETYTKS